MAAFLYFGGGNIVSINECYNIHLTVHVITSKKLLTKNFKKYSSNFLFILLEILMNNNNSY